MYCVIGLGYGDESKGLTVARLTKPGDYIVKFTGGAQCQHNVRWDGRHHTFSQFGSGMVHDNTTTVLGPKFLVDPIALINEADYLVSMGIKDPLDRIVIDPDCLVITLPMVYANQATQNGHGTTGRGIGTTVQYDQDFGGLWFGDLRDLSLTRFIVKQQAEWLLKTHNIYLLDDVNFHARALHHAAINVSTVPAKRVLRNRSNVIFEGSQGVLLDENYGWFPHVTRADTTANHAWDLKRYLTVVGVTRTYMTRHGNGPFPTQCPDFEDGDDNGGGMAGRFKRGYLDMAALRYSCNIVNPKYLVVTHSDIELPMAEMVHEYTAWPTFEERTRHTNSINSKSWSLGKPATPSNIANDLGVPLLHVGYGPDITDYKEQ